MSKAEAAYIDNVTRYRDGARRSAEKMLTILFDLIRPTSVVDVGCSAGTWLSVAKTLGANQTLGLDGDYVDRNALLIPSNEFIAVDLSKPFKVARQFDLVISLEVAEHLPEQSALDFVECLTNLGSIILFSAAVPFQGGTGHINEQWPDYWAALFSRCGYVPFDCIRWQVWGDESVDVWYAQNSLLYVARPLLATNAALAERLQALSVRALNVVHPTLYLGSADPRNVDPTMLSAAQCLEGLRFHAKGYLRRSLHWRLQRLLFPA
ncbi:MAG TPA: methyltransferase domain-containing protein [Burkholderiales bacterium]|nr:methyltransferase domain-containing protein [Burkholderiales bacterium]